jgi:hypothetical protein
MTQNDYIANIANCLQYKVVQYLDLLKSGYDDKMLSNQFTILNIYLYVFVTNLNAEVLTDSEIQSISHAMNLICSNPNLNLFTESLISNYTEDID